MRAMATMTAWMAVILALLAARFADVHATGTNGGGGGAAKGRGNGGRGRGGGSSNSLRKKRITSEVRDIYRHMISMDTPFNTSAEEIGIRLAPVKGNLLEFHFSFTGMEGSAYEGGIYHGRIRLHPEYPRKAPSICVLTPTGRWEVGKDICLSASAHHQETWDPLWNMRTLVMGLRNHIVTQPREIGAISTPVEHQRQLATASRHWACPVCGVNHAHLVPGAANRTVHAASGDALLGGARRRLSSDDGSSSRRRAVALKMHVVDGTDVDAAVLDAAEAQVLAEIAQVTKKFHKMRRAEARYEKEQRQLRTKLLRQITFVVLSVMTFIALQFAQYLSSGTTAGNGGHNNRDFSGW